MTRSVAKAAIAGMAAWLCFGGCPAFSQAGQKPEPGPQPAQRIDVAPLGYMPPGDFYLTYRLSSAALGFFDDHHLLFTFRRSGLLRRVPGDQDGDDDQEIRAVVLDVDSGTVLHQTEWRMHDRLQYLWPVQDGKFLVRIRNSLFLTDRSLELTPYWSAATELRSIQVSPNQKSVIVETDEPRTLQASAGDTNNQQPVKGTVLASDSSTVTAAFEAKNPGSVPFMDNGVIQILEGPKASSWVLEDTPFHGTPKTFAEVDSSCQPSVQPLSTTALLVAGCYLDGDSRSVFALTLDGKQLWQDRWQNRYVWPWFAYAADGSRFAYETLEVTHLISSFDPIYAEDIQAQLVGVYDTNTGKLVLVKNASPVLSAGQNAALSPDGKRFAVLRNGAIEIYDLPPVSQPVPAPQTGKAQQKSAAAQTKK